ncbi:flagellar protein FlbT [Kaistia soli DSM 19436]|uniref:Flagellar protein FlbT n=1 Tax=Kaistia soli DSM 19436 TaxID=1122133 RepID=A0A1M5A8C5_9HYPH|nr:flagellar biosynthesis repressor FlbT [Kaistia soli]SHF26550.1 flagellar protein FlbT [Kaistia soli DSM 19436]
MPLKLELKAGERVLLGDLVIVNQGGRTRLCIEGDAPVLRERDMMAPEAANSLPKRLYLAMQSMYLSRDASRFLPEIARLTREIVDAEPGFRPFVEAIERQLHSGQLYRAMREVQRLILHDVDTSLAKAS